MIPGPALSGESQARRTPGGTSRGFTRSATTGLARSEEISMTMFQPSDAAVVDYRDQTGTRLWTGGGVAAAVEDYDASCDTEFGPQISEQAWSQGGQPPGPAHHREWHTWPTALRFAGIGAGLAVAAAAAVLLYGAVFGDPNSAASTPPSPSVIAASQLPDIPQPSVEMPPWPPPPVGDAGHVTKDGEFLQLTLAADWQYNDTAGAIADAHSWCVEMRATGDSPTVVARGLYVEYSGKPGFPVTMAQYQQLVNAAVTAYCPEVAR
jgi:hypothetical protein